MDRIVEEYLPVKNQSWLEEGEPEVAEPEFRARIALDSIEFGEERTTVVFRDGDLFWGHDIEVRLEPGVQVREICL